MDEKTKAQFERLIESQLETLDRDIARLKELTKPIAPNNAIGRLSRMEAINEKSVHEANLRQAETRRSKLKVTLSRIDRPEFGVCIECEEDIPIKRLELLPESTVCMECLKEKE